MKTCISLRKTHFTESEPSPLLLLASKQANSTEGAAEANLDTPWGGDQQLAVGMAGKALRPKPLADRDLAWATPRDSGAQTDPKRKPRFSRWLCCLRQLKWLLNVGYRDVLLKMTHKKEVWAESTQKNLKTVLALLLGLANEPNSTWKIIEDAIYKDVSQKNKGVQSDKLAPIISKDFSDLKKSLKVAWHMTGKADQPNEDPLGTEKNGKWLHLHKVSSGKATTDAIQQCLDCLSRNESSLRLDSNEHIFQYQSKDQVRNELSLMAELPVYTQLLPGSSQGKMYRHFALDFSNCKTHKLDDCWAVIEQQINEHPNNPKGTKQRTGSSVKKLNPALTKGLNELVEALLPKLKSNFERRRRREQKHIHVPLKATIRPADCQQQEDPPARVPGPEDFVDLVSANDNQLLFIWEEGGAGKTSLAYQIASWGLERRLADYHLLPYFLDLNAFDLTSEAALIKHLKTGLDSLGGPGEMSEDDVKNLIRGKSLLLIVDHFSELTKEQRRSVWMNLPARSLVLLTSRLADHKDDTVRNSWKVTEIKPQRLQNQELLDFFKEYVEQNVDIGEGVRKVLLDPEHSLRRGDLMQRMVGHKPVTVLLAWLVMQNAIKHIEERLNSPDGLVELPPNSIPELMEVYVRECCGDKSRSMPLTSRQAQDCKFNPDIILASLKALALEAHRQNEAYHPDNFDTELAKRAFASVRIDGKPLDDDVQRGLLDALVDELTLVTCVGSNDTPNSKPYRISLDPLADYLAALKQQEIWQSSGNEAAHLKQVAAWLIWIKGLRELGKNKEASALEAVNHMRGFLAACRDCYTQWLRHSDRSKGAEPQQWQQVLNDFSDLAEINQQKERIMEAEYLIRRHAYDLEYNNFELRPKAIAEISANAQELKAMPQSGDSPDPPVPGQPLPVMKVALQPLAVTLADRTIPIADRAAAAEALGHIGGSRAAEILVQLVEATQEPKIAVRRAAAEALGLVECETVAHWRLLEEILASEANHLEGETDQDVIDAKLPLLQGAARGLQRLASRTLEASSQGSPQWVWGAGPGLEVPMLTLTTKAGAVTTRLVRREVWQVPLPAGLQLELVAIPGGLATLGSPDKEVGRFLYGHRQEAANVEVEAQRSVSVPPYAMARFPISQAQWRSLAGPEHRRGGGRELRPDPSQHKGADLPVESVSWHDCVEWRDRLNLWLSKQSSALGLNGKPLELDLPSETLWEVACRAGSTSPFHFGDTLDAAWANYNGSPDYVYPGGRPGPYLQRPSPVGAYGLVNDWGLADLHGNVWEWCADRWHPSPQGGPVNGQAWMEPFEGLPLEQQRRLRRGGSWINGPHDCRSAYRDGSRSADRGVNLGFRVYCLPPELSSWSFNL